MSNTANQLQEILKTLQTKTVVVQPQQSYMDLIDQAEQSILALFRECLPRPYSKAELEDMPQNKVEESLMINQAIDITAQNMRALGSSDEADKPCSCSVCYAQSKEQPSPSQPDTSDELFKILEKYQEVVYDSNEYGTEQFDIEGAMFALKSYINQAVLQALKNTKNNLPKKQHKYKLPNKWEAGYNEAIGNVNHVINQRIAELTSQLEQEQK